MTQSVPSDTEAAWAADVMQAAYFRGKLADDREHLRVTVAQLQNRLQANTQARDNLAVYQWQQQIREAGDEIGRLDALIDGLERRFPVVPNQ